jgi:hypothetical protein
MRSTERKFIAMRAVTYAGLVIWEWVFQISCSFAVRFFKLLMRSKSDKSDHSRKSRKFRKRSYLSGRGKFQPLARRRPHPSNPPLRPRRATSNSRGPILFCRV